MYQQRSVASVVVYSIITCGIYYFYWIYITTRDINGYLNKTDMDSGIELVLCIFVFPYRWYWFYKYAQRVGETQRAAGLPERDDSIICLILAIIEFGIISAAIMQEGLNKVWATEQNNAINF
jgi:hypothetical protein